ncbi:MAG: GntR family transcriptional regulator [Sporolactobacillus sp.]
MENVSAPKTSAEYAYQNIKQWIITGELPPDQKIDQDRLAQKLGVSRMPVRGALDKLAAQGFVILNSYRGVTVRGLSAKHLDDIYLTRCTLESLAVKQAIHNLTPKAILKLKELLNMQYQLSKHPDTNLDKILPVNRKFHMYIYTLADNPVMFDIINNLWDQSERYRRILLNTPGMMDGSTKEHNHLVQLMIEGQEDEAAEFLTIHNRKTQKVVLETMEKNKRNEELEK